jgi:hypothetical protein
LHDLDANPHSLGRCSKQAAKMQSKGKPKKMSRKMRGICAVTRLRIGLWRGMEGNQKWEESTLVWKGKPKKMSRKMRGICAVTHLRIGLWRGMEGNQNW